MLGEVGSLLAEGPGSVAVDHQWVGCAAGVGRCIQLGMAKNRERRNFARRKLLLVDHLGSCTVGLLGRIPDTHREVAISSLSRQEW